MCGDYGAEVRALGAVEPVVIRLVIVPDTYILSTLAGREGSSDSTVSCLTPEVCCTDHASYNLCYTGSVIEVGFASD